MTVDREKKINHNHKQALALLTKKLQSKRKKKYFKIEKRKLIGTQLKNLL